MLNCIPEALHKLQHKVPDKPQYAPHFWAKPIYGQSTQYENPEGAFPLLPPKQNSLVQKIVGTFLYYGLAVDFTMLVVLCYRASTQSK